MITRFGRAVTLAALFSWACCAASWAQQATAPPNPVMAHYRAYLAAFNANDLATAEAEAAKALEASIARDENGGNTPVLALNLAKVRLSRGAAERAYAPALQAFTIVSAGGATSVDPLVTQLVLGRTELTESRQASGRNRLKSALEAAATRADLRSEARDAAADLGRWFYGQQNFDAARDAWIKAGRLSNPVAVDQGMQIAEAKIAEAASRIMDTTRAQYLEQSRPTDTRLLVNGDAEYERADRALWEAKMIVGPAARANVTPDGLTVAQRAYANTLAWRNYVRAFVRSTDQSSLPEDYAQGPASGGGAMDGDAPCA
jgi:tetratricopeptide (TPR) repeat protein